MRRGRRHGDTILGEGKIGGQLYFYWDGDEIVPESETFQTMGFDFKTPGRIEEWDNGKRWQTGGNTSKRQFAARLKGGAGGHEFMMEFIPSDPTSESFQSATIVDLGFFVAVDFQKCMDTKGCFEVLNEHGMAGLELRSDNQYQKSCLAGETNGMPDAIAEACGDWSACLTRAGGRKDRIETLLRAAGVGTSISDADKKDDAETCIYPPTEDPASWDCDCWDDMEKRCNEAGASSGASRDSCLTAQYCMHPQICRGWAKRVCGTADVQQYLTNFQASFLKVQGGLSTRVESGSTATIKDLDATMDGKCSF